MITQADHNNMGSLSKQHEKTKMADSMVHFQGFQKCKFQNPPLELFGASGTRNRTISPLLQSGMTLKTEDLRALLHCSYPFGMTFQINSGGF